ncbi:MAG: RNA polymerase sigma factor [Hyphomicrobiales bacterium]
MIIDGDKLNEKRLIEGCLNNDPIAQRQLYKTYAYKMYPVCVKLAKSHADVEDLLQEGFIKVFNYLKNFRSEGSFEGWIRRIMVNSALNFYKRKNLIVKDIDIDHSNYLLSDRNGVFEQLSLKEIYSIIEKLPRGYQTVFKLSTIEGYSHKEIGKRLNISVNTSKSQLTRARSCLKKKLENHRNQVLN